jgi:hypothetical protein
MDHIERHVRLFYTSALKKDARAMKHHLGLVRNFMRLGSASIDPRRVVADLRGVVPEKYVMYALFGKEAALMPSVPAPRQQTPAAAVSARQTTPARKTAEHLRMNAAASAISRGNRTNAASTLLPLLRGGVANINSVRPMRSLSNANQVVSIIRNMESLPEGYETDVARVLRTYKNAGVHVAPYDIQADRLARSRFGLAASQMRNGRFENMAQTLKPLSRGNAENTDPDIRTLNNASRAIAELSTDAIASDPRTAAYARSLMRFAVSR